MRQAARTRPMETGQTLIEILVSLVIAVFIVAGAVSVFAHANTAYRTSTAVRALEATARLALTPLSTDIELAGFWGLTNRATAITGRAEAATGIPLANDCGNNWAVDLDRPVDGDNNAYAWSCKPYSNAVMTGADTLVLRHADNLAAGSLVAGRLYLETNRFGGGRLFVAPDSGGSFGALSQTHALVTRGYYVSTTSALSAPGNRVPSLRLKRLTRSAAGARIIDEEVQPGVEDIQFEYGIDIDPPDAPGFGSIDAYVNADALSSGHRIVAVRIWLLMRSLLRENGYTRSPALRYADRYFASQDDGYRRAVVSTTVFVRNAY